MNEVVDVLIKESYVKDVTEDCNAHAHTILNVVPVDEFRDSAAINSSLIRYWSKCVKQSNSVSKQFPQLDDKHFISLSFV